MRPKVLALDYDGTVADHGRLDPDVRAAIDDVRRRGLTVVLVTGRILAQLREVVGDLRFVDAVVAENGAVFTLPGAGRSSVLASRPPDVFVERLREKGLAVEVGQCVVEAEASSAEAILKVIRELELPLALLFNRSRLMVLPQAVSKATGLRQALNALRLSTHNAIGIGDAENDHELVNACEVGVAVDWGSAALKAVADEIVPGPGPAALAPFIRALPDRPTLTYHGPARRRLVLGHAADGDEVALAVRGRNVLVAGEPRSGKSWVAGLLCEQLILYGYSVCVIDAEGDYLALEPLPDVIVVGGEDRLPRPREIVRMLRHPDVSLVIDLSRQGHAGKVAYVRALLPMLAAVRRRFGVPHRILLDEAHYFLTEEGLEQLIDPGMHGYTLVTYRASTLPAAVLELSRAVIVSQESDVREVEALHRWCGGRGTPEDWHAVMSSLELGEAAMLPTTEEAAGELRRFRLMPRITPHVRHRAKYIDVPVGPEHAFVFTRDGGATGRRASTLTEFVRAVVESPPSLIAEHLGRFDFSRWIADVYGDQPLARELRELEDRHRLGMVLDPNERVVELVQARYEMDGD